MKSQSTCRLIILSAFISFSHLLHAADTAEQPPKYGISSTVLKNGLEVIAIENHAVPLVTVELAARNGAFTEPPDLDGLSHLYEHMFFKANREIPNQEKYMERLREIGATFNGSTSEEMVNYFITLPRENLWEGVEFMRDAIRYPLFKEEELIAERPVVTAEFDRAEATPGFHLDREVGRRMWYEYFSRKNVIGDRDIILTATREKMQTIQHRYYIPNNMALLIGGDVTPELAFEMAEELLGDWEKGPDPLKQYPIPKHPPLKTSSTVTVVQPVGAVNLQIEYHGPSLRDDRQDTYAADLLSFILGQPDSKFQRALVDEGHFDGISLGYYSLVHTGPISINGRTSADRFDTALAALDEQLGRLLEPDYFSDQEIQTALNLIEVDRIYDQEATTSFIHNVAFWWATSGLEYYMTYIDELHKVTRKDIERFVKRYIQGRPRVTGFLCTEEDLAAIKASQSAEVVRPVALPAPEVSKAEYDPFEFDVDGLRVILKPNPVNEIIALGLYFAGSVSYTGTDKAGIEFMALESATKGTQSYSKEEIDRRLAAMGTSIAPNIGTDSVALRMQCLKRNLDLSWSIFTDIIKNPLFDAREVELVRERHLNSIRQRKQNPDASVSELGRSNYYEGHPYAVDPEGTEETISNLGPDDLQAFHQQAYTRSRATLYVAGNLTQEEVAALVKSGLSDLPKGSYTQNDLPVPAGISRARLVKEAREIPTTYLLGYHAAPAIQDPDYAAMVVAERILDNRLFEEVRTKRSLSYAPASGIGTRTTNVGYLYVSTTKPNEAIDVMLSEVRRLIAEPVADKELSDNKNNIVTSYLQSNQTNAAQVSRLALYEYAGQGWKNGDGYLQAVEAVRPGDIQRVAKQYIHTISFAVLGDTAVIDPQRFTGSIDPPEVSNQ